MSANPNFAFPRHEHEQEPPRPLMRELAPAKPFPIDCLGHILGSAVTAIHDKIQAPIAIVGQSVLGAAALAVQGHWRAHCVSKNQSRHAE
jgi:hypothetical protein